MDFSAIKQNLEKHGFVVSCFQSAIDATKYLDGVIDGKTIGIGGSKTVEQMGLLQALETHNRVLYRFGTYKSPEEVMKEALTSNQTTDVLKRWQGEGTSNSMPRAVFGDPNQNTRVSDRFVENGSYLRLKNITLSYTFPKQWLQKTQIENARLSLSCENVATITGYSGFDPEVGINGIDQNRYPISRTFSLGLNFNF